MQRKSLNRSFIQQLLNPPRLTLAAFIELLMWVVTGIDDIVWVATATVGLALLGYIFDR